MKRLGLVTIGQTPRIDLVPEMQLLLGDGFEIIQKGALDGLSLDEVKLLYPLESDEVLVTRMADGTEVKVAERHISPRLLDKFSELEDDGINVIFLACTGEFPPVKSKALIIRPQRVIQHVVSSLAKDLTLGILIPDELQVSSARERWSSAAEKVVVEHSSPYGKINNISEAAKKLKKQGVDFIVMDCMGYSLKMKDIVIENVKKPVVLARSITAKVLSELLF